MIINLTSNTFRLLFIFNVVIRYNYFVDIALNVNQTRHRELGNDPYYRNVTPLMTAIYHRDIFTVRILLSRGANIEDRTEVLLFILYINYNKYLHNI